MFESSFELKRHRNLALRLWFGSWFEVIHEGKRKWVFTHRAPAMRFTHSLRKWIKDVESTQARILSEIYYEEFTWINPDPRLKRYADVFAAVANDKLPDDITDEELDVHPFPISRKSVGIDLMVLCGAIAGLAFLPVYVIADGDVGQLIEDFLNETIPNMYPDLFKS